jgi:hypothetical protein
MTDRPVTSDTLPDVTGSRTCCPYTDCKALGGRAPGKGIHNRGEGVAIEQKATAHPATRVVTYDQATMTDIQIMAPPW